MEIFFFKMSMRAFILLNTSHVVLYVWNVNVPNQHSRIQKFFFFHIIPYASAFLNHFQHSTNFHCIFQLPISNCFDRNKCFPLFASLPQQHSFSSMVKSQFLFKEKHISSFDMSNNLVLKHFFYLWQMSMENLT